MRFENIRNPVNSSYFTQIEAEIGLVFPEAVRRFYIAHNGGSPRPYCFRNSRVDTVVSEFMSLGDYQDSAINAYKTLIIGKNLLPKHFFPFATDGGGDYFFSDFSNIEAPVYFFIGDRWPHKEYLIDLHLSFNQFWDDLKEEE